MTSEFGDWTGDDPVGDDADTADLGGPVDGSGDPAVEGFGAADPVEGFGAADPPVDDDLSGDDTTGGGYGGGDAVPALGYGDDLSGAEPVDAGFGAEPAAEQGFGAADPPPGVDPDAPAGADGWPEAQFPPPLDPAGVPTPVDGWPWADPQLLGDGGPVGAAVPHVTPVDPVDLAGYAGADAAAGGDLWAALLASDDPATGTLARFWSGS
ncbi:hypothetical protein O7543_05120 [Solwaraspora sp. WMMA2080]|uniref:hypothetical protein n=1 Tax=unclassified Solwaraspora TaxID=2627926 RepID=UPI00248CD0D3|nr:MULTISPECIES: hypothetical protein [unclassified Solwaraspora]WBB99589.1 hypothetical protein O7553_12250 [Solwaraspora sp. WMMA2059]WBC21860.1 hypothetical protein O7543_05120 [Solwaraspora sp. WMMA2080]